MNRISKSISHIFIMCYRQRMNYFQFKRFRGIPIAMGKKRLLQNVGTTFDDHGFIQFYVDLECVVFTPKLNKKVRAIVNKIGDTYIGKYSFKHIFVNFLK
jgi:hypothetical protein